MTSVITTTQRVVDFGTDITYSNSFVEAKLAKQYFDYLEANVKWTKAIVKGRRVNASYGDPGVLYELNIRGTITRRTVTDWATLPFLRDLRDYMEKVTHVKYNYVVIQRYDGNKAWMKGHRDKEMVPGTTISGISLGAARVLTMTSTRTGRVYQFYLNDGSLYMLNPPTNDHNLHCIEEGTEGGVRISLTFRLMPIETKTPPLPDILPLPMEP
ncbi:Alpha-ketoglutarate-dependent repair dioxygenase AlkB [uncultured virus]|nr:Alpha-ketoglutarate-dependent repair dioxygenase AlkB [uncultured virus]